MSVEQPGLTDAPLRFGERTDGTRRQAYDPGPAAPATHDHAVTDTAAPPVRRPARPPALVFERSRDGQQARKEAKGRRARRKAMLRARRVRRIVRRLDPWSVLKVSFIFFVCVYVVSLVALVVLWNLASGAGLIENIESFIEEMGAFEVFEFEPGKLLEGAALGGAVLAVLATGLTALGSVLFNLISDLVGGIRLTVIEEPTPMRPVAPTNGTGSPNGASDTVTEPSGETSRGYSSVG